MLSKNLPRRSHLFQVSKTQVSDPYIILLWVAQNTLSFVHNGNQEVLQCVGFARQTYNRKYAKASSHWAYTIYIYSRTFMYTLTQSLTTCTLSLPKHTSSLPTHTWSLLRHTNPTYTHSEPTHTHSEREREKKREKEREREIGLRSCTALLSLWLPTLYVSNAWTWM